MLTHLYRKLHALFFGLVMLIIAALLILAQFDHIRLDQLSANAFFQKMASIAIQDTASFVQEASPHWEEAFSSFQYYESRSGFAFQLLDEKGALLYESASSFPTSQETLFSLLDDASSRTEEVSLMETPSLSQSGVFPVRGLEGETYLGLLARIPLEDGRLYSLNLLMETPSFRILLERQLFPGLLLFFAAGIAIFFLTRFLLTKALEPTKEAFKSQKAFIASASHELKSPLAVILANAEVLKNDPALPSAVLESAALIDSECLRMSRLIQDMLLLAAADSHAVLADRKKTDVDTLLISLYEAYQPLYQKAKVRLLLNLKKDSYPPVFTDPERLFQILSIFLDNALCHSKSPSVEIGTAHVKNGLLFSVADHGPGIPPEDRPYLFQRFYCADKARTAKEHFGLGLSIAQELARMLGGRVGLQDTPGGGITFYFIQPLP